MSVNQPEDVWLDLNDPNKRAYIRRIRICRYGAEDPYVHIFGCYDNGDHGSFTLRVPAGDLDRLIDALRKFTLGPLGRLAIDAENNQEKP